MKTLKHASVLVFKENNKILLTRRAKTLRKYPGEWCFPGGLNDGESALDCVLREVKEEIFVDSWVIRNPQFLFDYRLGDILVSVFICSGIPEIREFNKDEIQEVRVFDLCEVPETQRMTKYVIDYLRNN